MINFEVLMEVILLWFASPERHLLCAHISGMRYRNCRGASGGQLLNSVFVVRIFNCVQNMFLTVFFFLSVFFLFQAMVSS